MRILILLVLFVVNRHQGFLDFATAYWRAIQLPEVEASLLLILVTLLVIGAIGGLTDAFLGWCTGDD